MQSSRERPSVFLNLGLAGCSSMCGAVCTNSLDLLKTRVQLSSTPLTYVQAVQATVQQGGVRALLFRGLSASLLREGSYSAIRMGLYEPCKQLLGEKGRESLFIQKALAGAMSGALGALIASPTDLLKVRMFRDTAPKPPTLKALCSNIYSTSGIVGFWRGVTPNVQRAALLTPAQLAVYDQVKHYFLKHGYFGRDGAGLHFLCSFIAGFTSAAVTNIPDVAKSRMMADHEHIYRSSLHCLRQVVMQEGPQALAKGFLASWMRIGPHTTVTFMVFEQLRILFRKETI